MKRLLFKSAIYIILILILLEGCIRFFHLTKDYPDRYIDEFGVEKWVPNQDGYSVTGIRRQNISKFHINSFGFNSYREFRPSIDKTEIALIGDSFVEGFHQHYYNSIGKKIENVLPNCEVYEFGYAGYDLADQLHLIYQYQSTFDLIDHVILGLKFDNDLSRGEYGVLEERMNLESPLYRNLRKIKLLVYLQKIGAFDAARSFTEKVLSIGQEVSSNPPLENDLAKQKRYLKYIRNFESLVYTYGFDKNRYTFLIDKEKTPKIFINYLENNGYQYIDFSKALHMSKRPTTLIYDMHWNDHGRDLIANLITHYISKE